MDDVKDQQLNVFEIVVGHYDKYHENDILCKVDIDPATVERPIVRHVDDDFINDNDEKSSIQIGSSDDEEQ